ncbi:MAG: Holliday junction branch migration protein RuvA [Candidatus Zophobacter franzmannii]|nr:Holliday junction branch migration protein RuvA [Candidatus Zophobacter franzmannii]
MYEYINGVLIEKEITYAVVDANGVGYYIHIPLSTFEKLPQINETVKLFTHHLQAEDSQRLFGFLVPQERQLFRLLMTISGVGPKLSLAILSSLPVQRVVSAVMNSDDATLSTVSGLGKKTAARLIIELKDKISVIGTGEDVQFVGHNSEILLSAETALINLGYSRIEVRRTLNKLTEQKEYSDVQKLIKDSIKLLYKKGML